MASYRQYPATVVQLTGLRSDEAARVSKVAARTLRDRAAKYRRLAHALVDQRVISEVQACAVELDAEAAQIESEATSKTQPSVNAYETRVGHFGNAGN
jgi:hypothetical protein